MSVNLTRLLSIVAFAVGIMAIFSVSSNSKVGISAQQSAEKADYVLSDLKND